MTTTVICVTSQKGGVAKTTTATTIAHALARQSKRTLLVDFDPQGQAAISLGLDPAPGIYRFFVDEADSVFAQPNPSTGSGQGADGLVLLPGNSRTRTAEAVLRSESSVDQIMQRFGYLRSGFDFIVIDTPSGGLLQEVAIRLADVLVVPVQCEVLGLDGVAATLQIAKMTGCKARIIILPTMFDGRLKEHKLNLDLLTRNYPSFMAEPVPARAAVKEAVANGRTIWQWDGGGMAEVREAYGVVVEMATAEGVSA